VKKLPGCPRRFVFGPVLALSTALFVGGSGFTSEAGVVSLIELHKSEPHTSVKQFRMGTLTKISLMRPGASRAARDLSQVPDGALASAPGGAAAPGLLSADTIVRRDLALPPAAVRLGLVADRTIPTCAWAFD